MTSLEDLKKDGIELPTYKIKLDQVQKVNGIISENKEIEDFHFPDSSGTNFPIYLDPYGTRLFITKKNELIIEDYNSENNLVKKLIKELNLDDKQLNDFYKKWWVKNNKNDRTKNAI